MPSPISRLVAAALIGPLLAGLTLPAAAAAAPRPAGRPAFARHRGVAGQGGGDLAAVSCATPKFCIAVDRHGSGLRFNGRSWGAPRQIEPARSGIGLTGVSCPTASFCAAVDQAGAAVFFNGHRWSRPVVIDNAYIMAGEVAHLPLTAVSCVSPHFCVATDEGSPLTSNGDAVMFSGTDPSAAVTLPTAQDLESVSCVSAMFCVAISSFYPGYYQIWRHDRWAAPRRIGRDDLWRSVSCVTSSYCVASDYNGDVTTFNGRTWSRPRLVDPGPTISSYTSVSCASRRSCMIVTGLGAAWWNGRRWGRPVRLDRLDSAGLDAVSCPTARFCVTVDAGNPELNPPDIINPVNDTGATFASAAEFDGRTWSRLRVVDRSSYITAASCSSPAFCAVVTAGGMAATFNGVAWSRPAVLRMPPGNPPQWLSCPAAGFCVATDDLGHVYELRHRRWSSPERVARPRFGSLYAFPVSCATSRRCVAVDSDGRSVTFNGSRWSRPRTVPDAGILGFTSISCPSVQRCVAVTASGTARTLRGRAWSRPAAVSGTVLATVSCATSDFCLTSDDGSSSWRFSGERWTNLDAFGVTQFSCSASGFCGADISENYVVFYSGGHWTDQSSGLTAVVGFTTAVSCFRTSFCLVTDTAGNAFWS